VANAIKFWRLKKNISQKKLADLIGIDRPILSKIENPDVPIEPNEELAVKISRILDVLVTDIIKGKD
jgi:transcriptional regulator with XRE-family HTH domain